MILNTNQKYLGLTSGSNLLGTTLVSNEPAEFSGTNFIKIVTDVPLLTLNTANSNNNVLHVVNVDEDYGNQIIYNNDYPVITKSNNINRMKLKLLDEFDDPLQVRSDWNAKLIFFTDDE